MFKEDWYTIHDFIINKWEEVEEPVANVRDGDILIENFKERNLKINYHQHGYRSLHYIIKTTPFKKPIYSEIQVRTIFEEGWSEIDHLVRYPYDQNNPIIKNYVNVFNRIAGTADEMASFLRSLKIEFDSDRRKFKDYEQKNLSTLSKIDKLLEELKIDNRIKYYLELEVNELKKNLGLDYKIMAPSDLYDQKFPTFELLNPPIIEPLRTDFDKK